MRKIGLVLATGAATLAFSAGTAQATAPSLPPQLQTAIDLFAHPVCDQQGGLFYLGTWTPGSATYSCKEPMRIGDLLKGAAVCTLFFHGTFSVLPKPPGLPLALIPSNNGYMCTFSVPGGGTD